MLNICSNFVEYNVKNLFKVIFPATMGLLESSMPRCPRFLCTCTVFWAQKADQVFSSRGCNLDILSLGSNSTESDSVFHVRLDHLCPGLDGFYSELKIYFRYNHD